ncbi:MAG TPA: hypothetical protein VHK88_08765, partial [Aquihabitans sp.]|nr:hypothetical protein [Aquihabitans sp.]
MEDRRTPATVFVVRRGPEVDAFLAELDAGALDAALARALRRRRPRRLRNRPRGAARRGVSVGIEHEYRIVDPTGGQVDARTVLHDLGLDGVRADPSDPNAYRCPWGGVVTCDGPEVEVATAPFRAEPGVVDRVVAQAADGRAVLEALLPAGHVLEGFSTHVSVSMPRHGDDRLARRYASTFAPALMLLLDGPASPGLLVRPRPGRLELC